MVLSLLPMNVFGVAQHEDDVNILIPYATVSARAGALGTGAEFLNLVFEGVEFRAATTISALAGIVVQVDGDTVTPNVTYEGNEVWFNFNTILIDGDIEIDLPALSITSSEIRVRITDAANPAATVLVPNVIPPVQVDNGPLPTPTPTPPPIMGTNITRGVVQNQRPQAEPFSRNFLVTVDLDQLQSNPGQTSVGMNFILSGGDNVRFSRNYTSNIDGTGTFAASRMIQVDPAPAPMTNVTFTYEWQMDHSGNIRIRRIQTAPAVPGGATWTGWSTWRTPADTMTAGNGTGTGIGGVTAIPDIFFDQFAATGAGRQVPRIVIHETSQIVDSRTNVRIPDGHLLFTAGELGDDVNAGRLAVSSPISGQQEVGAWLTLSGLGRTAVQNATSPLGDGVGGFTDGRIQGIGGVLVLEIQGIVANESNSRLTVRREVAGAGQQGTVLINNQILVVGVDAHGLNFEAMGGPRSFVTGLLLPQIRIIERRPQSFHQAWSSGDPQGGSARVNAQGSGQPTRHEIRLLGPRDYAWNTSGMGILADPFNVTPQAGRFVAGFTPVTVAAPGAARLTHNDAGEVRVLSHHIDGATGRPALVLEVVVPERAALPARYEIAHINLNNLALVPVRDVPQEEIYIDISVGEYTGQGFDWVGGYWFPIAEIGLDLTNAEMGRLINFGRNATYQPTVEQANNAIGRNIVQNVVGQRVFWEFRGGAERVTRNAWNRRTDNWQDLTLHVGTRTEATLLLTYDGTIPTRISGQRNFPDRITLPHNDPFHANNNLYADSRSVRVQIEEIVPGAFDTGWMHGIVEFHLQQEGIQFTHANWRIRTTPAETAPAYVPWSAATNVTLHDDTHLPGVSATGVPLLTPDALRLFVPRSESPQVRRTLEVVFFVSIVAGYEFMFDGEPVSVVVSGNAVQNLEADNREAILMYVEDPIRAELIGDLVRMEVGQVMTPFEITPIGDIRITEREAGTLPRGTTFRINIEAMPIPVLGGHALVGTHVATDPTSGLEVRATHVGTGQDAYVRFEVIRESQREPGVIYLTNNAVMGTFLPAIEYGISINALPIAANPMPPRIDENPIAQNTARGLTGRGNFDMVPYFVQIVSFAAFDYDALPPGVGIPGPGQGGRLTLHPNMQPIAVREGAPVDQPFFLWTNPQAPGYNVGMLNPRVFAEFIGGTATWEGTSGTVTGHDANGNAVTVVFTMGSNFATVNGQQVDIASFAGASGPANSIQPLNVNDRIFVPLRFIANAFLLPVGWAGGGVVTLG